MRRVIGWLAVATCCTAVAFNVPGIVGDAAPVFAVAALLLAVLEAMS